MILLPRQWDDHLLLLLAWSSKLNLQPKLNQLGHPAVINRLAAMVFQSLKRRLNLASNLWLCNMSANPAPKLCLPARGRYAPLASPSGSAISCQLAKGFSHHPQRRRQQTPETFEIYVHSPQPNLLNQKLIFSRGNGRTSECENSNLQREIGNARDMSASEKGNEKCFVQSTGNLIE